MEFWSKASVPWAVPNPAYGDSCKENGHVYWLKGPSIGLLTLEVRAIVMEDTKQKLLKLPPPSQNSKSILYLGMQQRAEINAMLTDCRVFSNKFLFNYQSDLYQKW